ncbi:MAG: GGDEF domain-containing protein [Cyanobacteria bacterium J06634_6]
MNSVLLIGYERFIAGVQSQVRGLDSLNVVTATSITRAFALLESLMPEVIIVQATLLTERSVTKTFHQSKVAYIVVVDVGPPTALSPAKRLAEETLDKTASALESGADAYLWLPSDGIPTEDEAYFPLGYRAGSLSGEGSSRQEPQAREQTHSQTKAPLALEKNQCRLIQAHIQLGLRSAQRYRDLSRINDWLSAVALIDALTQLNNRRAFDLELPNQIQLARTKGTALSLMVLDIDHFKSVNDRFGHLVGDDMLKQLANRLLTNMRFYDTPFRYGGEEFVVILANTELTEGLGIANRIRETIAQEPFELTHPVNEVKRLDMTLSVGITQLHSDDDSQGRSFVGRADHNLLAAKAAGRNQVVGE